MRILLSHSFYQSTAPSGEDNVFRNELGMLEKSENEIFTFTKNNDDLNNLSSSEKIKTALNAAWSEETYKDITRIIKEKKPEVAHFHNTFPQISPSAYAACADNGVAVVQTLHNYRLICSGAMLYRNGKSCEKCIPGKFYPGLLHRCYRDSYIATAAVINMLKKNWKSGVYQNMVNRYIALSEFANAKFIQGGLPKHKLAIKPNFLPAPPEQGPGGETAVFVGRLSKEKGAHTLLEAWQSVKDRKLIIIGDGPLRADLEQIARQRQLNIEFAGFCSREQIFDYVGRALFQVIPSETYEGFPMVVLEAYACGTPVVASRLGSLNELVEDDFTGIKFAPGDPNDLARILKNIYDNPDSMLKLRSNTRNLFTSKYTEEKNLDLLHEVYNQAIIENN